MSDQYNNTSLPPTASAPFPGSLTPGWNDPPPVASASGGGRQRLDLRKRVAYPIQSTQSTPVMSGVQPPAYPSPPAYTAPTHQTAMPPTQQSNPTQQTQLPTQPQPQQQPQTQYNSVHGWQT